MVKKQQGDDMTPAQIKIPYRFTYPSRNKYKNFSTLGAWMFMFKVMTPEYEGDIVEDIRLASVSDEDAIDFLSKCLTEKGGSYVESI